MPEVLSLLARQTDEAVKRLGLDKIGRGVADYSLLGKVNIILGCAAIGKVPELVTWAAAAKTAIETEAAKVRATCQKHAYQNPGITIDDNANCVSCDAREDEARRFALWCRENGYGDRMGARVRCRTHGHRPSGIYNYRSRRYECGHCLMARFRQEMQDLTIDASVEAHPGANA